MVNEWMGDSKWMNRPWVSDTQKMAPRNSAISLGGEKYFVKFLYTIWWNFFFFLPAFNPNNWHENLYSKQERQILRGPHRSTKGKKRKQKLGWYIRNNKPRDRQPTRTAAHNRTSLLLPRVRTQREKPRTAYFSAKFTWTKTEQERRGELR